MDIETANALTSFTTRYCDAWHEKRGTWPQSTDLYGVPSPCIIASQDDYVIWQPKPFTGEQNVNAVERAMDIVIQPALHAIYTTQFAGDMTACFAGQPLTLLQTWSEDDLQRVQENLIGHLVTQNALSSPRLSLLRRSTVNWTSFQSATCLARSLKRRSAPAIATFSRLLLRIFLPDLSRFCNP